MSRENSSSVAFAEAISWSGSLLVALMLILSSFESSKGGELLAQESPEYDILLGKPCDEIYVVREGETLQTISEKCGDPYIVEENPHIHDPDDVFPGLVIKITPLKAKSLGLKTPVAYAWRKIGAKKLRYGMNFAYGGSGVFDTLWDLLPNMTAQIDLFENLMNESLYTKWDFHSSVVLVSLAGNDYGAFLQNGGTIQGLQAFIPRVVNQLALNLKRITELGARKIVVTALQPLGCLPRTTQLTSFQQCNATQNTAVQFHNLLLHQAVAKLNNETKRSNIFVLNLYDSFTTVLYQKNDLKEKLKFESPLKPCSVGTCAGCFCASVDEKGTKLYTVCSDPKSAFFWDSSHPTQAGWRAVYTTLKSSLEQFI